jgi:hypothetical protein
MIFTISQANVDVISININNVKEHPKLGLAESAYSLKGVAEW